MSSKREKRITIRNMPNRPGLMTGGQQTTVPELGSAWQLGEATSDLDGMPIKRPGLTRWGQIIKTVDSSATGSTVVSHSDFLKGVTDFVLTDNSLLVDISTTTKFGVLRTNVGVEGVGTGENIILSHTVTTLSTGDESSLRFSFQGTNLPAYVPAGTVADTFSFRVQGQSGSGKEFAIWSGGLYYKQASDNTYVLVSDSEILGNGVWRTIEVRIDDNAGETNVYMDDILLTTTALTSADLADATLTGTSAFEFLWQVENSPTRPQPQYSTQLVMPMYNDTITAPFKAVPIVALTDYRYQTSAGSDIRSLLAGAGNYIYHDSNLRGLWRPLLAKVRSDVYFATYRTTIVWSDNNGAGSATIWQWDGSKEPERMETAPSARFLVEHQQRLFAWGDVSNPRRVYYSGDRKPDVWFTPSPTNIEDEFSEVLDAGYLEIPSKASSVTAAWGDYFGLGVIFADNGIWKLSGDGTFSYRLQGVTLKNGAVNAHAVTQVGNDLWVLGRQGITTLAGSDKFGDLQQGQPSGPIQNLWSTNSGSNNSINQTYIDRSKIAFNARSGKVYVATPSYTQQQAQQIHEYNSYTDKWFGPWAIDARAMADALVASPVTEVVMFGDSNGQIGYLNSFDLSDYGASYTMTFESVAHDGRSIPGLGDAIKGMVKVWSALRLFILPRGDFDYVVTWWTDDQPDEQTRTRSQIDTHRQYMKLLDGPGVIGNFRLDLTPDGLLQSGGTAITHDIPLNARGKWLTFKIEQDGVGQDFAFQGYELEAVVAGYEEE